MKMSVGNEMVYIEIADFIGKTELIKNSVTD